MSQSFSHIVVNCALSLHMEGTLYPQGDLTLNTNISKERGLVGIIKASFNDILNIDV